MVGLDRWTISFAALRQSVQRLLLFRHGNVKRVERHCNHRVKPNRADQLNHLLFTEHRHASLEVSLGQRAGGVEFHGDVVNQAFVVAGEIWRAALADGFDDVGGDAELEGVGRVDEPGELRGGEPGRYQDHQLHQAAFQLDAPGEQVLKLERAFGEFRVAQPDGERAADLAAYALDLVLNFSLVGGEFVLVDFW